MKKGLKIGFKNFKKFQDFPMIELAPITFLVGPNNSGKSSFIKAFTFLFANLDSQKKSEEILPPFTHVSFHHNRVANFEWGDFSTTLNRNQETNEISFSWELRGTFFCFNFGASKEEILKNPSLSVSLPIKTFTIKNDKLGIVIENSRNNNNEWSTVYKIDPKVLQEWLKTSMLWLKKKLKNNAVSRSFESWYKSGNFSFNAKKEELFNEYKQAEKSLNENEFNDYILFVHNPTTTLYYAINQPVKQNILIDYCNYCVNYIAGRRFGASLISPDFVYIETHNAPHSLAINRNDKNSFLAQTIADYYSKVPQSSKFHSWVIEWMKKFGIGNDFKINTHFVGEIYTVDIVKENETMPLGTLGTGGIQLFLLLLKLATILETIGEDANIVVLIEEPEQNLHPALQSKLAELFFDVYDQTNGRVSFVIETHSEYLIRHTQVMVAKEHYADEKTLKKDNPFKVYYFPKEGLPYDMGYQLNGKFIEDFGSGFCDEAYKQAVKLFEENMK